jgi:hypothetical protein
LRNIFTKNKIDNNKDFIEKHKDSLLWWYKFRLDTIETAVKTMDGEQLVMQLKKLFS